MSTSISTRHPTYGAFAPLWELMTRSYSGAHAIKAETSEYLPPTTGMLLDGYGLADTKNLGNQAYDAYIKKAVYPDFVKDASDGAVGKLHRKPPQQMELPGAMEVLIDQATLLGEDLPTFLRKVNLAQVTEGRIGIMGDIRPNNDGTFRPVLVSYHASSILNWNDSSIDKENTVLTFVELDETGYVMQPDFTWKEEKRRRVLAMCSLEGEGERAGYKPDTEGTVYCTTVLKDDMTILGATFEPVMHMGQTLERIPFVFVNAMDISPTPDLPPFLSLAYLALTVYNGEADYRQTLFQQSQDTLVEIGATFGEGQEDRRVGTGSRIVLPLGGDAKFIGTNSQGLSEQRTALENDYKRATEKSGKLADVSNQSQQSGEALKIRIEAQTFSLPMIAKTGAGGVQELLRLIAPWFGVDPAAISIVPNNEFTSKAGGVQDVQNLQAAKADGAPISNKTIHGFMVESGITTETYEDELELMQQEAESGLE